MSTNSGATAPTGSRHGRRTTEPTGASRHLRGTLLRRPAESSGRPGCLSREQRKQERLVRQARFAQGIDPGSTTSIRAILPKRIAGLAQGSGSVVLRIY